MTRARPDRQTARQRGLVRDLAGTGGRMLHFDGEVALVTGAGQALVAELANS